MLPKVIMTICLALLFCLSPLPADSYFFSSHQLINQEIIAKPDARDTFEQIPPSPGMGWQIYKYRENLQPLSAALIRDENLLDLVAFERSSSTIIPVVPAQLYIRYAAIEMERFQAIAEKYSQQYAAKTALPPGIPVFLKLLYPKFGKAKMLGLLEEASRRGVPVGGWGVLDFLLMDEGIFSAVSWSWENFLPRLLSIIALVVAALLFIEFLRIVVMVGLRMVSGQERRRP